MFTVHIYTPKTAAPANIIIANESRVENNISNTFKREHQRKPTSPSFKLKRLKSPLTIVFSICEFNILLTANKDKKNSSFLLSFD